MEVTVALPPTSLHSTTQAFTQGRERRRPRQPQRSSGRNPRQLRQAQSLRGPRSASGPRGARSPPTRWATGRGPRIRTRPRPRCPRRRHPPHPRGRARRWDGDPRSAYCDLSVVLAACFMREKAMSTPTSGHRGVRSRQTRWERPLGSGRERPGACRGRQRSKRASY